MKLYNYNKSKDYSPEDNYQWRLKWLKEQIKIRESRGEKISKEQKDRWYREEKHTYDNAIKDLEVIEKLRKDLCIVVSSHHYHNVWLKSCLKSLKTSGYYIILVYDNPLWDDKQKIESRLPGTSTLRLADQFIMNHKNFASGVGISHSWLMYLGTRAANSLGFKYTFFINGDCILEKPEYFDKMKEVMVTENYDAITCDYTEGIYFGTMAYFIKTEYAQILWDKNMELLYTYNQGNAEGRLGVFSKKIAMEIWSVENPSHHHFHPNEPKATFRELLGLRHLHAELKLRRREKLEPIEEKYFNKKWANQQELKMLEKYWKSKNKKYLQEWWTL